MSQYRKYSIISVFIIFISLLFSSCGAQDTPVQSPTGIEAEPALQGEKPDIKSSEATDIGEAEPVETQITIDGDPSDWESYEVMYTDPQGDHQNGGFDIAHVRAFTNDQYLYVLIETYEPPEDYVQIDLDVTADLISYLVILNPGAQVYLAKMTVSEPEPIGDVVGSLGMVGEAVEMKVPLSVFGDASVLTVSVRPMGGQCCETGEWYAIDNTGMALAEKVDEVEPIAEGPQVPQVCAYQIPPSAPYGSLEPTQLELMEPAYSAEWFVAPGAFNMPMETFITPDGDMLVQAIRSGTLFRVGALGSVTPITEEVHAYYQGDVDAEGNVYLLQSPSPQATIARISPDGKVTVIARSRELSSVCVCPLEIGPDGNLYASISNCAGEDTLVQVTQAGQVTRVRENFPDVWALHTTPGGRLLAATHEGEIFELSLDDYSLTSIGRIPGGNISPSGLTADNEGNIYISTGSRNSSGQVYHMSPDGTSIKITDIPNNGLSGIEWLQETGEIVGAQLVWGGIIAVKPDGSLREIVTGNGIITPFGIAFSPCGELATANDDGGMMGLVDVTGNAEWFFDYLSFIPPTPFVAFSPDGTLYASEAEPMPDTPKRVAVLPPGGMLKTLFDGDFPSGLAYSDDGVLFVSETTGGRITQVNPDGSTVVAAEGLRFPQALALDVDDNLYAVTGPSGFTPEPVFPAPTNGDRIIRITPDGEITTVSQIRGISDIIVGPDDELYATVGGKHADGEVGKVIQISADQSTRVVASGFAQPTGIAFDVAGYLYVADEVSNSIARIAGFPQGILSGTVVNETGAPVEGARVQVLSVDPIVVGQVVFSDADGGFSLPVAPRTYSIIVTANGYEDVTLDDNKIIADQEIVVEIELKEK